jgi:hypothetical protein
MDISARADLSKLRRRIAMRLSDASCDAACLTNINCNRKRSQNTKYNNYLLLHALQKMYTYIKTIIH